jgi:diguanylate cyclase
LTRALRANEAPELDQILAGTTVTKSAAEALQQPVVASGHEIERPQSDLSRARIEVRVDPLARILNRKGFDRKLQAMLDQATEPLRSHSVVMLDIDRFETVNDAYGHVMGDRILHAVAEALRGSMSDPARTRCRPRGHDLGRRECDADRGRRAEPDRARRRSATKRCDEDRSLARFQAFTSSSARSRSST